MESSLIRQVWLRAQNRCEYCQIDDLGYPGLMVVDHIIARQHDGPTTLANLALACLHCNSHKGPNLSGIDPKKRKRVVPLYHPRRHRWARHFRWEGPMLVGMTATGRATIQVLNINDSLMVRLREELIEEKMFPPE